MKAPSSSGPRSAVAADEARSPSPDARPERASEAPAAYDRSVDAILGSILRRIVEAYQREAVYLFGSRARHQADADSIEVARRLLHAIFGTLPSALHPR